MAGGDPAPAGPAARPLRSVSPTSFYDTESRQIFVDDQPRIISAREASVLEILLRRQGRVVPKKNVEDHIFGLDGEVASNAVEVYVSAAAQAAR